MHDSWKIKPGSRTKIVTNHDHGWQTFISVFESHIQLVKGRFLSCSFAKKKVLKECLKNSLKVAKRKSKTTNSNLQKYIILIWCFHFLYFSSGSLETENHQRKIRNNITGISIVGWFEVFSGHGQPFGHGTQRIIHLNSRFMKNKNR